MNFRYSRAGGLAVLIGLAFCGGCAQKGGLARYALSGNVAMPDGTPVPAGEISFEPDGKNGNQGPGSVTQIKAGRYSLLKDQGTVGGKYVVTILPFDGVPVAESAQGKPLIKAPYSQRLELPAKDATQDFKIGK